MLFWRIGRALRIQADLNMKSSFGRVPLLARLLVVSDDSSLGLIHRAPAIVEMADPITMPHC